MICLGYCSTPRACKCGDILEHLWSQEDEEGKVTRLEDRYEKWYGKTYQEYYDLNLKQAIYSKIIKEQKENDIKKDIMKGMKMNKLYWGIIGFPNDISMNMIKNTIEKLGKLKIMQESMYSVEFYSDEGKYNPHIHLLIRPTGSYTMSKLKIQLKKLFKPFIVKHLEDVKQSDIQDKILYLEGNKQNKKLDNVKKDIEIRENESLSNLYSRGNIQDA